jgi:hypothetical protein
MIKKIKLRHILCTWRLKGLKVPTSIANFPSLKVRLQKIYTVGAHTGTLCGKAKTQATIEVTTQKIKGCHTVRLIM